MDRSPDRALGAGAQRDRDSEDSNDHSTYSSVVEGRKALVVGIANEHSIAWGCAKWLRSLGADLAITYLNENAKKFVVPLAEELESEIFMPMNVSEPGQIEAVFDRIAKEWGRLDTVVHSIAFSPKEALCSRVVDVSRDGFMTTIDVSCWSFMRMAHLAEPLMTKGGTLFTMSYYGSQMVVENYNIMGVAKAALESAVRHRGHRLLSDPPTSVVIDVRALKKPRLTRTLRWRGVVPKRSDDALSHLCRWYQIDRPL